jgi:hypothetical protein
MLELKTMNGMFIEDIQIFMVCTKRLALVRNYDPEWSCISIIQNPTDLGQRKISERVLNVTSG